MSIASWTGRLSGVGAAPGVAAHTPPERLSNGPDPLLLHHDRSCLSWFDTTFHSHYAAPETLA